MTLDREDIAAIATEVVRLLGPMIQPPSPVADDSLQEELEDRRMLHARAELNELEYQILLCKTNAERLKRRGNMKAARRMTMRAARLEKKTAQ